MIEQDTIGLTWQPTTIIYEGKEYPAPQIIEDIFKWNVRQTIINILGER